MNENSRKRWTQEEDAYLRHWVGVYGIDHWNMAHDLQRTQKQVAARCYKLGIKKGKMPEQEEQAESMKYPAPTGVWQSAETVPVNEPVLILMMVEGFRDRENYDAPPPVYPMSWAGTLVKPMRGKAKWHDINESEEMELAGKLVGWMPFPRAPYVFAEKQP